MDDILPNVCMKCLLRSLFKRVPCLCSVWDTVMRFQWMCCDDDWGCGGHETRSSSGSIIIRRMTFIRGIRCLASPDDLSWVADTENECEDSDTWKLYSEICRCACELN